jgi:hypothetical protein
MEKEHNCDYCGEQLAICIDSVALDYSGDYSDNIDDILGESPEQIASYTAKTRCERCGVVYESNMQTQGDYDGYSEYYTP